MRHAIEVVLEKSEDRDGGRVVAVDDLETLADDEVAFFTVRLPDENQAWKLIRRIRQSLVPKVYLRPIILQGTARPAAELRAAADGMIDSDDPSREKIEEWTSHEESVNQWIDALPDNATAQDKNLSFKTLRLLASRDAELEPLMTSQSPIGYIYPLLTPITDADDADAFRLLEFLEAQDLINPRFVTKTYSCSHCDSAFLSFKETCEDCGSEDLRVAELVHHFRCGYVGEKEEFEQKDQLVCPKCDRQLRSIGADYDKPSIIYVCRECGHRSQQAVTTTRCFHCGRSNRPENQSLRIISAYSVSAIGQNAALYGLDALFTRILESELRLWSLEKFEDFLEIERARIERYKLSTSSLVLMEFKGLDNLYVDLGRKADEIFKELSRVLKSVLRTSDLITARNESVFMIILTETAQENAGRAVERIESGIESLLEGSLEHVPELSSRIENIDQNLDLQKVVEAFLS